MHLALLLNVASLSLCHQISLGHRFLASFLQVDLLLGLARSILDFMLVDWEQSLSTCDPSDRLWAVETLPDVTQEN